MNSKSVLPFKPEGLRQVFSKASGYAISFVQAHGVCLPVWVGMFGGGAGVGTKVQQALLAANVLAVAVGVVKRNRNLKFYGALGASTTAIGMAIEPVSYALGYDPYKTMMVVTAVGSAFCLVAGAIALENQHKKETARPAGLYFDTRSHFKRMWPTQALALGSGLFVAFALHAYPLAKARYTGEPFDFSAVYCTSTPQEGPKP